MFTAQIRINALGGERFIFVYIKKMKRIAKRSG